MAGAPEPPGGFTVLRTQRGRSAVKRWSWNPTLSQWLKRDYNAGYLFSPTEEAVGCLDELAAAVVRISADPRAFIIRGALKSGPRATLIASPDLVVRRQKLKKGEAEPAFWEVPRSWLMIDIDQFPLRGSDDLVDDPEAAVAHAIDELLPQEFHDVRCFFQLSASAGFAPGILKAHVFFWLAAPIIDAELKAIMRQCAPRLRDYSVYQGVQPLYVAAPEVDGGPDPIPRRFGWIDGANDAVTLPTLLPTPPLPAGGRYSGASGSIADALARVGDGDGLDGFHAPLRTAIMRYAARCTRDTSQRDDTAFKRTLVAAAENAPRGPHRQAIAEYTADDYLQRSIDGAVALILTRETDHQPQKKPHLSRAIGDIEAGRKEIKALAEGFLARTLDWHMAKEKERGPAEQAGIAGVVGSGKSTITRAALLPYIDAVGRAKKPYRVLWLIPTHALGREVLTDFESIGIPAAVWAGREYLDPMDPAAERMCLDVEAVQEAVAIGLDVEKHICGNPDEGPVCPFHDRCKYQAQKNNVARAEVVISAHQSLFGSNAKVVTKDVGLVITDESWWQAGLAFERETRIAGFADAVIRFPVQRDANAPYAGSGKRDKDRPKMLVDDESATRRLADLCVLAQDVFLATEMDELVSKAAALAVGLTPEACHEAVKLEWRRQIEPEVWPGMPKKMRKDAMEAAAANASLARRAGIWRALAELLEGPAPYTGRLQIGERSDARGPEKVILLHSRREISNQLIDLPILAIDAALPEKVLPHFLPRFNVLGRIDAAAPHMTVTQIIRGWGRSALVPSYSDKVPPAENRRRVAFLAELRDFVALHAMETERGALAITYQAIENNFANLPDVTTGHFNALRGIDAHRDVGSLFVIGRPLPHAGELRVMAMALTGEALPVQQPHRESRGLVMADGTNRSIEMRVYANPTLEAMRAAITDAEVTDNVGRARAVNRKAADENVHVWLLTDVVTALPVASLMSWDAVRPSIHARMAARGCVFECSSDAYSAYPDLFPNPAAAKVAIHRDREHRVTSLYEESTHKGMLPCGRFRPVRYQLPGERKKPRTAWFHPALIPTAQAWLEERLGPLVACDAPARYPVASAERSYTETHSDPVYG